MSVARLGHATGLNNRISVDIFHPPGALALQAFGRGRLCGLHPRLCARQWAAALQFATTKKKRGPHPMQDRAVGPTGLSACLAVTVTLAAALANATDAPPVAAVRPIADSYFGTPFTDNYRYLENLQDPQ